MLPKYEAPCLSREMLTDDIMNAALERENHLNVSVQTAREACYMFMSRSSVCNEELEQFQKEAEADMEAGVSPLDAVVMLSTAVEEGMMWESIRDYRGKLNIEEIGAAMKNLKIEADPETMSFLLAAFVVGGDTALAEYDDIMKEEHISKQNVLDTKKELEEKP